MKVKPIGIIHSPFLRPAGTPIQPVFGKGTEGAVEVLDEYAQGLKDLDGFERIWLIYWFDRCRDYSLVVTPYMDTEERGLFATRAPARPNPIGMSAVGLERVEGSKIYVSDIDILDGTPLLDIKPYSPKFDCFEVSRIGWLENAARGNHKADERFHR
ncbi:MAG TPA: tRNA (N6-threonylcarbamoyladenosine(37)-N6)-methyltransferase TrmO [Sedimentisphaerales bacterium]|nr:tRNA (N6-threonylcarbamoyladenosine(37)-N6)-methyltransferase TrmO [Sedimentisphaerales bacterium]